MGTEITTFHINPLRRFVLPAIFILLSLFIGLAAFFSENGSHEDMAAAIIVCPILLACAAMIWGLCTYPRIIISPESITHVQVGYRIQSEWKNVASLVEQQSQLYLILKESGGANPLLRQSLRVFPDSLSIVDRPDLLAEGKLIDLTPFSSYWHNGPMKELLECHLKNQMGRTILQHSGKKES